MSRNDRLLVTAILFLGLAFYNGLTVFTEVSLAAKIGFFIFGFGSGLTFGVWLAERLAKK